MVFIFIYTNKGKGGLMEIDGVNNLNINSFHVIHVYIYFSTRFFQELAGTIYAIWRRGW